MRGRGRRGRGCPGAEVPSARVRGAEPQREPPPRRGSRAEVRPRPRSSRHVWRGWRWGPAEPACPHAWVPLPALSLCRPAPSLQEGLRGPVAAPYPGSGPPSRGGRGAGRVRREQIPVSEWKWLIPPPLLLTAAWIFAPLSQQLLSRVLGFVFRTPPSRFGSAVGEGGGWQHPASPPPPCQAPAGGVSQPGVPGRVLCRGRCCSAEGCQPSLCGSAASSPTPRSLCGPQLLLDLVQQ